MESAKFEVKKGGAKGGSIKTREQKHQEAEQKESRRLKDDEFYVSPSMGGPHWDEDEPWENDDELFEYE